MTAALLSEKRISLGDLADREGVHRATVDRWCTRGIKGHKLSSFSLGHKKFTTVPAFERWMVAINGEPVPAGGVA
jgi:hypothetical protein